MDRIVLIGFATSGKSSVGRLLADKLNAKFVDTDEEIEREQGATIQQIFDEYGEEYFRNKESEILTSLAHQKNVIVACGGGSVLCDSFVELAQESVVVWLTVTAATVKRRLGNTPRPLFDNLSEDELAERIARRSPLYQRYAEIVIETDSLTPEQVAERII